MAEKRREHGSALHTMRTGGISAHRIVGVPAQPAKQSPAVSCNSHRGPRSATFQLRLRISDVRSAHQHFLIRRNRVSLRGLLREGSRVAERLRSIFDPFAPNAEVSRDCELTLRPLCNPAGRMPALRKPLRLMRNDRRCVCSAGILPAR